MSVIKNDTLKSTSRVEADDKISSTSHQHDEPRGGDDVTAGSMTTGADVTLTSHTPAVRGDAAIPRRVQVPDPADRWLVASRPRHGVSVAVGKQRGGREDTAKTRSAVVVIASLFFAATVAATLVVGVFCRKRVVQATPLSLHDGRQLRRGVFCRKRNTVFVLQKCEQRDYAVAAGHDDDDDDYDAKMMKSRHQAGLYTKVLVSGVSLGLDLERLVSLSRQNVWVQTQGHNFGVEAKISVSVSLEAKHWSHWSGLGLSLGRRNLTSLGPYSI